MQELPCRVCLQTENAFVDMFSIPLPSYEGNGTTMLEMFSEVCEIAMQEGDNSILCTNCQKRLFEAYKFKCDAQNAIAFLEKVAPMCTFEEIKIEEPLGEMISSMEMEPLVKAETDAGHHDVNRKSELPSLDLHSHCRFCLSLPKEKLREHEQLHIRKWFYFISLKLLSLLI